MSSNESFPHVGDDWTPPKPATESELLRVLIFNLPLTDLTRACETDEQVALLTNLLRKVLNER